MLYKKEKRTLICYAGSASEASIGSKPVGSELEYDICTKTPICQHFYTHGQQFETRQRSLGNPSSLVNWQCTVAFQGGAQHDPSL